VGGVERRQVAPASVELLPDIQAAPALVCKGYLMLAPHSFVPFGLVWLENIFSHGFCSTSPSELLYLHWMHVPRKLFRLSTTLSS